MQLPGHLSIGLLQGRLGPGHLPSTVVLGALTPDLADKLAFVAGTTPYGRTVGHALVLWVFLACWFLARPWPPGRAFVLGGLGHLGADLIDDLVGGLEGDRYGFSAWWGWPLLTPDDLSTRVPHLLPTLSTSLAGPTLLELATVLGVLAYLARRGR
jgi:hypothetical protein